MIPGKFWLRETEQLPDYGAATTFVVLRSRSIKIGGGNHFPIVKEGKVGPPSMIEQIILGWIFVQGVLIRVVPPMVQSGTPGAWYF